MKLYYITDAALDNHLVETVHVDEVCKGFVALGHEVTLYAPDGSSFESPDTYTVNLIKTPRIFKLLFFQIFLAWRLFVDLSKNRPDVIYSRYGLLLFLPVVAGKLFGIPTILEINGKFIEETPHMHKDFITNLLLNTGVFNAIELLNMRLASGFVVVTSALKTFLVEKYAVAPDTVDVVPNAVDVSSFKPMDASQKRAELGLSENKICIGYLGSLHDWQGLDFLVEAMDTLTRRHVPVQALIVGEGAAATHLIELIRDRGLEKVVILHDAIPHTEAPLYINVMDICLHYPRAYRGGATSPFKVYEYLACGKPTILADIAGMREEFEDSVIYVQPESAEELATAISSLIVNDARRTSQGMAALTFIENGRTWRSAVERIVALCMSTRG